MTRISLSQKSNPVNDLERFERKISKESCGRQCWRWTASLDPKGYGQVYFNGKVRRAHRVSYEIYRGPIPEGLQLDHLCRVRSCVNPAHLEPVTCRENLLRGQTLTAACAAKTHCPRGHAYSSSNTRIDNNGSRNCLTCIRARKNASYRRVAARDGHTVGIRNKDKKTCKHGHPFNAENTHIKKNGSRGCRVCDRNAHRKKSQQNTDTDVGADADLEVDEGG